MKKGILKNIDPFKSIFKQEFSRGMNIENNTGTKVMDRKKLYSYRLSIQRLYYTSKTNKPNRIPVIGQKVVSSGRHPHPSNLLLSEGRELPTFLRFIENSIITLCI